MGRTAQPLTRKRRPGPVHPTGRCFQRARDPELWNRFTASFFSLLWDSPGRRKRWALRWRTETAVREIAEDLGWEVAASLDRIIPLDPWPPPSATRCSTRSPSGGNSTSTAATPCPTMPTGSTTASSRKSPRCSTGSSATTPPPPAYTIGEIIGEATDRFGIPRKIAENTIETALTLDSELSEDILDDFLARIFDPDKGRSTT